MMASFNPFQMMMGGMGSPMGNPMQMMQRMMGGKNFQNNVKINPEQMKQFMPNINKNMLAQLVDQARQKGISEEEIEKGLDFLLKLS